MTKAILINYEYCTGCHSCEVACKKRLGLPEGEFGIRLTETGPWEYAGKSGEDRWEWSWVPCSPRPATCAPTARMRARCPCACSTARRGACTTAKWTSLPRRSTGRPVARCLRARLLILWFEARRPRLPRFVLLRQNAVKHQFRRSHNTSLLSF